jgi:hypothetical protein
MYTDEDLMKMWLYFLLHSWNQDNAMSMFDAIVISDALAAFSEIN